MGRCSARAVALILVGADPGTDELLSLSSHEEVSGFDQQGGTMERTAIISVDGHVRASRAMYRDYVESRHRDVFDDWVRSQEEMGVPDQGGVQPG